MILCCESFPFGKQKRRLPCFRFCVIIQNMDALRKNETFVVDIDGYTSEALGVCHIHGRAVFVPNTLLGERWEIQLVKVTATVIYGRGLRLLSPALCRVPVECPYFGKCGGCDTWHMSYEEELRFKRAKVDAALQRIGKQQITTEAILGSSQVRGYRNKGIFAFATRDGQPVFGFYRPRSHDLIPIDRCLIQSEWSCRTAAAVRDFLAKNEIPVYDEKTGRGRVRHVFCRQAIHTKDAVVCIVATGGFGEKTQALIDHLRNASPELTGIVLVVNKQAGNAILSGDFHTLWGKAEMEDSLCGLRFEIAPQAFFQIHPPQAERLYQQAAAYALEASPSLIFDLYCGAGTISLCLAQRGVRVIGAEIVPEAVENAAENAKRNGLENVEFLCADAGQAANALASRGLRPDVIVVDPPRKGMTEDAISACASMAPERIVYVSCNPATLARDILRFQEHGYNLKHVTAVDMFPKTSHVETVVLMSRIKEK